MAVFALILVAWGIVLDLLLLFALPFVGQCGVMGELVKMAGCDAPLDRFQTLTCWLFAICGCVRAHAGFYPTEKGVWYAAASTFLSEVALTIHLSATLNDAAGAIGLGGSAGVYMMLAPPAGKPVKQA